MPAAGGEPVRINGVDGVFDPVFSPDSKTIYAATGSESIVAIPVSVGRDRTSDGAAGRVGIALPTSSAP